MREGGINGRKRRDEEDARGRGQRKSEKKKWRVIEKHTCGGRQYDIGSRNMRLTPINDC